MAKILTEEALRKMTLSELRKTVKRANDIANKRITRIQKAKDVFSPAVSKRHGEKFTTSGKDNQDTLINKYKEVHSFLKSETSTLKGARAFTKRTDEKFKGDYKRKNKNAYEEAYEAKTSKGNQYIPTMELVTILLGVNPLLFKQYDSDQVMAAVNEYIQEGYYSVEKRAEQIYDEVMEMIIIVEHHFEDIEWFT